MNKRQQLEQDVYKRFIKAANLITTKGYSINKATKEAGISKNTFRQKNSERGNLVSAFYKKNKKGETKRAGYEIVEKTAYATNMPVIAYDNNGDPTTVKADFDKHYARILGSYWHEIGKLEQDKKPDFSSLPDVIYDRHANAYRLVKDLNTLYLFLQMQTDEYMSEIWKQFQSEKRNAA